MEDVKNQIDTATSEADNGQTPASASPAIETTPAVETPLSTRDSLREVLQSRREAADTKTTTGAAMASSVDRAIDPISGKELEPIRAPGSWTPALREKWSNIDREAQKFIADRDKHVAVTLQEAKEARDFTKKFRDVAAPYTKHFPAGVDAAEVAGQLFQIDHTVRNGTPAQKAQLLFEIMQRANPDMNVLNNLMRGYAPQQVTSQAPAPNFDAEVQKRVHEAALSEQKKQQDEQLNQVFEQFSNDPANEFMYSDDIRIKMGKAIQSGLVGGATDLEALQNAYQFVCRNDDQVQAIMSARGAQGQAVGAKPQARPVGSVAPSLGSGSAKPTVKADSTREALRLSLRQVGRKV